MNVLLLVFGRGLVWYAVIQVIFVTVFAFKNLRCATPRISEDRLPKVAILVGLRGADPFLLDSLKRLISLDYPQYEIRIVIDDSTDPAWGVVERAICETGASNVHVEVYCEDPRHGLVNSTNSKIVQAVRGLDDSIAVIAMMDGDALPHADWLRDLVTPLVLDESIGATYGNRWFVPPLGQWGSICRLVWNATVVPPMDLLKMPWGGCYAIRADAVRRGNMVEEWSRVIALDACSKRDLLKQGLRLQFVPQMIMLNSEECALPFCLNFIRRQLTWTWLYHPNAILALAKPAIAGLLLAGTIGLGLLATGGGNTSAARIALNCLGIYWALSAVSVLAVESLVRRFVQSRGENLPWLTSGTLFRIILAIPLMQFTEFMAAALAVSSRRVQWRGVTLEIHGPHKIGVLRKSRAQDMRSSEIPRSY